LLILSKKNSDLSMASYTRLLLPIRKNYRVM
ncbi:hypothetical protein A5868_001610, partial [Enterococcus sp. 12F9_DIV0723]